MDVFAVVADPTRREMLDMLAKGERPAGEFVEAFPSLSQPAVSRHLRVLKDVGLVESRVQAQQRIYVLRPERLKELDEWVARYRKFWPDRLDALAKHLDETRGTGKGKRGARP